MEFQHTNDWYRERLGYFSGSRVYELLGKPRAKDAYFSETALSYIHEKMGERLLDDEFVNDEVRFREWIDRVHRTSWEMEWGNEYEPTAKLEYMSKRRRSLTETGSMRDKNLEWFSASPDALILNDFDIEGVLEVKSPQLRNFAKYCVNVQDNETLKKVNPTYYYQTQAEMMVTSAEYCDFMIYHPYTIPNFKIVRIYPDNDAVELISEKVTAANEYISEQITKLKENGE